MARAVKMPPKFYNIKIKTIIKLILILSVCVRSPESGRKQGRNAPSSDLRCSRSTQITERTQGGEDGETLRCLNVGGYWL